MGKIGRRRKYSHWKYINSHGGNSQTQSSPVLPSCHLPTEYQFPVFSVLTESNTFKNSWNLTCDATFDFVAHLVATGFSKKATYFRAFMSFVLMV